MCQAPTGPCPTIRANARLRRSRQWKDQQTDGSGGPSSDGGPSRSATGGRGRGGKRSGGSRRGRRGAPKQQPQHDDCAASASSNASTAPLSSDESHSSDSVRATQPRGKNGRNRSNSNASDNANAAGRRSSNAGRRKRTKNAKPSRPRTIEVVPELTPEEKARYVALDAEMVGVGPGGHTSRLARISLVDYDGEIIYDAHVKVAEEVTDYRTFVSGITAADLEGEDAVTFDEARDRVEELIKGKVVVGHGLKNDFRVLFLHHPWHLIRDTARYEPFMRAVDPCDATPLYPAGTLVPKKLRVLAKDKLGMVIQEDGVPHSPVEDAVAALELYKKHRAKWEKAVAYKVERTRAIESARGTAQ